MITIEGRGSGLILRDETVADRDFTRSLYHAHRIAEFARSGWPKAALHDFLDSPFQLQSSHFETRHPNASRWIVESRGEPAGRLYVDRSGTDWHLIEIGLLPDRQDIGTGTALLGWLLSEARFAEANSITLYVANENRRAASLYARLGFADILSDSATHRRMKWRAS